MKHINIYINLLLISLLSAGTMHAMVYNGTPHEMTQPNGETVTVYLFGSELYIDAESEDHYTLTTDESS